MINRGEILNTRHLLSDWCVDKSKFVGFYVICIEYDSLVFTPCYLLNKKKRINKLCRNDLFSRMCSELSLEDT